MMFIAKLGLAIFIFTPVIAGIIIVIGFVISEMRWPNTTEHSTRPNALGIYLRVKPGKEKLDAEKGVFMDSCMSKAWVIGIIGGIILSFIFVK